MAGASMKNLKYYRNRSPEFLADLIDNVKTCLIDAGVSETEAEDMAREVGIMQAKRWWGQLIYFPSANVLKRSARDEAIYNDFTGKNRSELAQKYGTSLQWIYRITARMDAEAKDRRQGKLFPPVQDSSTVI